MTNGQGMCDPYHGVPSVFTALQNDAGARATLRADLAGVLDARPWLHGVDIDLERGGSNIAGAERLFGEIADTVHAKGRKVSAALPALTSTGSIGGEHWVRYRQLGALLDHVSVMSYDFAWAGSAPGPISPWSWITEVYDWVTSQIPPRKLSMGVPAYGRMWRLHDYVENLTTAYRGASTATYPGARLWLDGTWVIDHPTDPDPQPHLGWLAYRDPDDPAPWAWIHVYDAFDAQDNLPGSASGLASATWGGRQYTTRYPLPVGSPLWSMADQSEADVPAAAITGTVGARASGSAWFDHLRVGDGDGDGDGWWYQPQEAVRVETGAWSWTVGRIARQGVTWDTAGRFRPVRDVEEASTRTRDISLDWDYDHVRDLPLTPGQSREVTIRPLDPGVWVGRVLIGDRNGFGLLHYSDAPYLRWLADRARHTYDLAGIAIWSLGQEDNRLWEVLAGGQLPE